jgi:membrane protease subunit (stomatin/prohibitin family)
MSSNLELSEKGENLMDMLLWLVCIPGGNLLLGTIFGAVGMFYAMHKGWIGGGKKSPKWTCGFCENENAGDAKECSDCGVAKAESLKERRRKALAEARRRVAETEREADEDGTRTEAEQRRIAAARTQVAALEEDIPCPNCGQVNTPEMKFCGSCGVQITPPPPSPLRPPP